MVRPSTSSTTTGSDQDTVETLATTLARTNVGGKEVLAASGSNGNGSGNGSAHPGLGRGATRGVRERVDRGNLRTRPDHVITKQGSAGTGINHKTNYFLLKSSQENQRLLKYHVEFSLESIKDISSVKKALLYGLRDNGQLPNFITDGMHLFLTEKLDDDPKVLETKTRKGETSSISPFSTI